MLGIPGALLALTAPAWLAWAVAPPSSTKVASITPWPGLSSSVMVTLPRLVTAPAASRSAACRTRGRGSTMIEANGERVGRGQASRWETHSAVLLSWSTCQINGMAPQCALILPTVCCCTHAVVHRWQHQVWGELGERGRLWARHVVEQGHEDGEGCVLIQYICSSS